MSPRASASSQPISAQTSVRQRFGHNQRRVHRQPVPMRRLQAGGEPFGGAQDVPRLDGPAVGACLAGQDLGDRGALVQPHPHPPDGVGQSADQLGRLDPRTVRLEQRTHCPVDPDPFVGLRRVQQPGTGLRPDRLRRGPRPQPLQLRRVPGHDQFAALGHVRVDSFGGGHPDDLVHGLVQQRLEPAGQLAAVAGGIAVAPAGHAVGQPAAVAAGRAEAGEAALQHHHVKIRPGLL